MAAARYKGEWEKPDVIDAIGTYVRDGVFVHFSDLEGRYGFNPSGPSTEEHADNPRGTYCYPWTSQNYEDFKSESLPEATDRKFVHVLEAAGSILNVGSYSKQDFQSDAEKIAKLGHDVDASIADGIGYGTEMDRESIASGDFECGPAPEPYQMLHGLMFNLYLGGFEWGKLFRRLGYDGIVDDGFASLGPERSQAVFFTPKAVKQLKVFENPFAAQEEE